MTRAEDPREAREEERWERARGRKEAAWDRFRLAVERRDPRVGVYYAAWCRWSRRLVCLAGLQGRGVVPGGG